MIPFSFLPPSAGEGQDRGIRATRVKARELRNNPTEAEQTLWQHLCRHQFGGHKFRRQVPLGQYIVDFVCLEEKLIIEVDGGQHSEWVLYDTGRTVWLETQGFRVLRFWNHEILRNIDAVKEMIAEVLGCSTPLLNPPPQGGRKS